MVKVLPGTWRMCVCGLQGCCGWLCGVVSVLTVAGNWNVHCSTSSWISADLHRPLQRVVGCWHVYTNQRNSGVSSVRRLWTRCWTRCWDYCSRADVFPAFVSWNHCTAAVPSLLLCRLSVWDDRTEEDWHGHTTRKQGSCLEKEIMQGRVNQNDRGQG